MKKTDKGELRLRLPKWILDELEASAMESGIEAKPIAAAAAQVLEEWARRREDERAYKANEIDTRERRLKLQAARMPSSELKWMLQNARQKVEHFREHREELVPLFEIQARAYQDEIDRRTQESDHD